MVGGARARLPVPHARARRAERRRVGESIVVGGDDSWEYYALGSRRDIGTAVGFSAVECQCRFRPGDHPGSDPTVGVGVRLDDGESTKRTKLANEQIRLEDSSMRASVPVRWHTWQGMTVVTR